MKSHILQSSSPFKSLPPKHKKAVPSETILLLLERCS